MENIAGSEQANPEEQMIANEDREQIHNLIRNLDPEHRQMVYLYYYEELKVRQIAKVMEIPVGTVKSRLYGIRDRLKKKLGAFDG